MPFLAGQSAWPSALSRARSLRLSERSVRPLTEEAAFALGLVLFGQSPRNWNVTVRDSFRLPELRGSMPGPLLFATIALPAMIFSPIGGEILFRGVIQQAFTLRWKAGIGTTVNSFSFGLVHLLIMESQETPQAFICNSFRVH
ncbi:MAG: hypothetical protein DMG76_30705 [Acidobacteria bacterium]|nr:MAG: hypothetical protein DMG76_30705 [Acidobacteriota bacterium]